MYEELVEKLRSVAAAAKEDNYDDAEKLVTQAADAIEKLCSFIGAEDAERMEAYPPKEE